MNQPDAVTDTVVIERNFDSPIEQVWQMWTTPELFATWYGPVGATIPVCEMNVTEGGKRRVCMQFETPSGPRRMWFTGVFVAVVAPTLLVYTESASDDEHAASDDESDATEVRLELSQRGTTTFVVLTHSGIPAGSPGEAGWRMALDKLAELVDAGPGDRHVQ
jgi:uncharacterized protein YndB with AHSA1/START domain